MVLVSVVVLLVLLSLWIMEIIIVVSKGYGEMFRNFVGIFGWGMFIFVVVLVIVLLFILWLYCLVIYYEFIYEEELVCENF